MACWSGFLEVNVSRAVGVLRKTKAVADNIPIDWIRHKVIVCVAHSQRPERIVGRKTARREVHDVVARARYARRPIHRLGGDVYGARKYLVARGSQQHAVAGHAASVQGGPAVDLRDFGTPENLCRDEREHGTDNDALYDARS